MAERQPATHADGNRSKAVTGGNQPTTATDWNRPIIEEFRANGGAVGGAFEGAPLVLLTTAGARTGRPHTVPVVYLRDGDRILVFASNAGRPRNPDWYHNLLADPQVIIEIGTGDGHVEARSARAVPLEGEERDRLYDLQAERDPAFREYQAMASRTIPVIALYPLDLAADPARSRVIGEQLVRHHDELRRELARVRAKVDELLAGHAVAPVAGQPALSLGSELLGHCLTFCHGLRMHHIREDGAFSAVEAQFPGLASVLDRLRREHRLVARALADLQALLAGPASDAGATDADRLRLELERLACDMEEHFTYEERQLLPALGVPYPSPRPAPSR